MKNICSMKTIAVLFLALFCFMGAHKAFAGPLSEQEEVFFKSFIVNEDARPAIRMAYWMMVRNQVKSIQVDLPERVHPSVVHVGILYDNLKTVYYAYFISDPTIDLKDVRKQMVSHFCQDPQIAMYITMFEGSMVYTYFLNGNVSEAWGEFRIDPVDCGVGI